MTNPSEPRQAEEVPVTLMRIEGMVGGVAKDIAHLTATVTDIRTEVVEHRGDIGNIKSQVQQLQSDAKASARAVVDAEDARQTTAQLLKEATKKALDDAKAADDKKVFDAKTLVEQSASTWLTPMRLAAIFGTVFTGLGVALAVYVALKG